MPGGNGPDTGGVLQDNITWRESEQTSGWSGSQENFGEPPKAMLQMTADTTEPAGAIAHGEQGWHDIDWDATHTTVRRLQARIVKAGRAKRGAGPRARRASGAL